MIEAIASFQKAASMMCDSGRFTNAAKIQKEIAGIFEADEKYEEAVDNYRMAADYYSGEVNVLNGLTFVHFVCRTKRRLPMRCCSRWQSTRLSFRG